MRVTCVSRSGGLWLGKKGSAPWNVIPSATSQASRTRSAGADPAEEAVRGQPGQQGERRQAHRRRRRGERRRAGERGGQDRGGDARRRQRVRARGRAPARTRTRRPARAPAPGTNAGPIAVRAPTATSTKSTSTSGDPAWSPATRASGRNDRPRSRPRPDSAAGTAVSYRAHGPVSTSTSPAFRPSTNTPRLLRTAARARQARTTSPAELSGRSRRLPGRAIR